MREQILQDIKESIIAISMELLHAGKDWFTQHSYEKWALLEIQDLILQNPEASPWDIVEEFINLMDRYSLVPHPNNHIFCVAHDTAWSVLVELMGEEPLH